MLSLQWKSKIVSVNPDHAVFDSIEHVKKIKTTEQMEENMEGECCEEEINNILQYNFS